MNIHYLDYATHSDIILCNSPNCTHDDESCSSFQDDAFLVRCGLETLDVKYGDSGTYTMLNSQYATINKSDFWDGIENYNYFA